MRGRAAKHRPAYESKKIERRGIIASALMIITVASLVGPGLSGSRGGLPGGSRQTVQWPNEDQKGALHQGSKGLEGRNNLPTIIPRPSDIFARTQPTTHSQHTHNHTSTARTQPTTHSQHTHNHTSTGTDLTQDEGDHSQLTRGGRSPHRDDQNHSGPWREAPQYGATTSGIENKTTTGGLLASTRQEGWTRAPYRQTVELDAPSPGKMDGNAAVGNNTENTNKAYATKGGGAAEVPVFGTSRAKAYHPDNTPPTPLRNTHPHHTTLHAHDPINGTGTDIKGPRPGTTPDTGDKGETEWGQQSDRGAGENRSREGDGNSSKDNENQRTGGWSDSKCRPGEKEPMRNKQEAHGQGEAVDKPVMRNSKDELVAMLAKKEWEHQRLCCRYGWVPWQRKWINCDRMIHPGPTMHTAAGKAPAKTNIVGARAQQLQKKKQKRPSSSETTPAVGGGGTTKMARITQIARTKLAAIYYQAMGGGPTGATTQADDHAQEVATTPTRGQGQRESIQTQKEMMTGFIVTIVDEGLVYYI